MTDGTTLKRWSITVCILLAVHVVGLAAAFYVAPDGKDNNPGTRAAPLKTLEAARDAVRKLRIGAPQRAGGVTVWIRGGVYRITKTFALDPRDSGTKDAPIVYRACGGEEVRLSGGRELEATAFQQVTDPAILARLPEVSRGKVVQVDLRAQGITDFGRMRRRGFGHPYANAGLELFFNDQPLKLARWPNNGVVPIGKVLDPGSTPRNGDFSNRGAKFTYNFVRPARWKQADDFWLSGFLRYGFADDTIRVQSIDVAGKTITLAEPHVYGVGTGKSFNAYYVFNLLEEIDRPGEWYLDRKTGILYFWPPGPLENAKVSVSLLEGPMVAMEGVSFVTLRGLTFEIARGIAVYIERGTNNLIAGCTFRNLGLLAVCIGQGAKPAGKVCGGWVMDLAAEKGRSVTVEPVSRQLGDWAHAIYGYSVWNRNAGTNHSVVGCDIYNTGAGGISLGGGDRRTLTPARNSVLNCHIHHFNRLERSYRTAVNVDGVGNRISHCLIHDAPGGAILLHGNDHLIEFNEVYRTCLFANDMGVFYMGRNPSQQGDILRYNFWHDNNRTGGVCVLYFDDGTCGATVIGNVFYSNRGTTVWINGGHDNVFHGNMFIDSRARIASGWDNKRWRAWVRSPLELLRLRKEVDITQPPYVVRYPKLANTFEGDPSLRRGNEVWNNVSVRSGSFGVGRNDVKNNLVLDEDPGFVDAAAMNFTLKPDSTVLTKIPGFHRIPFAQIGLYADDYRKSVPPRATEDSLRGAPPRDAKTRQLTADFAGMERYSELAGQDGWASFGPGPAVALGPGIKSDGCDPGTVAVAAGVDSWGAIWHRIILDPAKDIVLQLDGCLPTPLPDHSFFELYLNRGQTHAAPAFGIAVVGGAEDGRRDAVGVRQDSCGPRVLTTERLIPGHWYRLRLIIPANGQDGSLYTLDLTAGEKKFRVLTFANGAVETDLTRDDKWRPNLPSLDALVLRLGGGAQAANISLAN